MGSVWLAEHAMLGRRAALKVLHPEYSSRPEIVTRFFNEARAATTIADPGIVQIFDFGHHFDGSAYIVMELLDGEPLDRRLARLGALELPDALRIMRQVASTLGAAHARGIVHRDLKPENVFIIRDPEVAGGERAKILDFGIAKLVGNHGGVKTETSAVMGTPIYMSPEQCRGAGRVDQRSDVYALGCVLFTLLVGHPPFDAEGVGDIIAMHLREAPQSPSSLRLGIPPEVDQLVLRCLAKDPAQRFAHGGEFALALSRLLASSPQFSLLGSSATYAVSAATTLSSAAGTPLAAKRANSTRTVVFVVLGPAAVIVVLTIAMNFGGTNQVSPEPGSASMPIAVTPTPVVGGAPPLTPPVRVSEPNAEVSARMKDVLIRFVAWSRNRQNAPCPDIGALNGAAQDPWDHAFHLTCTAQPSDQIIGAISAGPDGSPGTTDDIASWQLGHDVTDLVRGVRWGAAARTSTKPEQRLEAEVKHEPGISHAKPPGIKPAEGVQSKQSNHNKRLEVDENGLPINR